ncbi:MAG: hypothetical protein WBX14_08990 [Candidatus Udaeobacter sp.]
MGDIPSGEAVDEAVAREGANVAIWLRKCNDEVNEGKVLPITLLEIRSQLPNGSANLTVAPNKRAEILLAIRLGNARTSRLILKDLWNKKASGW